MLVSLCRSGSKSIDFSIGIGVESDWEIERWYLVTSCHSNQNQYHQKQICCFDRWGRAAGRKVIHCTLPTPYLWVRLVLEAVNHGIYTRSILRRWVEVMDTAVLKTTYWMLSSLEGQFELPFSQASRLGLMNTVHPVWGPKALQERKIEYKSLILLYTQCICYVMLFYFIFPDPHPSKHNSPSSMIQSYLEAKQNLISLGALEFPECRGRHLWP